VLNSHGAAGSLNGVPVGYMAHVWGAGKNPEKGGPHYGWALNKAVTVFPRFGGGGFMTEPVWPSKPFGVHRILGETSLVHNMRGFGRVGADFWGVLEGDKGGARSLLNRYPEAKWSQLTVSEACGSFLAPGPDGAVSTVRFENLREGIQECEARISIEKALVDKALRGKLGDELAKKCEDVLAERTTAILDAFKRGKQSKGWDWFATDWQARSDKLFAAAAEVAAKLK
jgi:hypothetical protein